MILAFCFLATFGLGAYCGRKGTRPINGESVDHLDALDENERLWTLLRERDKSIVRLRDRLREIANDMAKHNGWAR